MSDVSLTKAFILGQGEQVGIYKLSFVFLDKCHNQMPLIFNICQACI